MIKINQAFTISDVGAKGFIVVYFTIENND